MSSSPAAAAAEATGHAWSREEEKAFENALATLLPDGEDGANGEVWEQIAGLVGGRRTAAEVMRHYEALVDDVAAIEAGKVPIPSYAGEDDKPAKEKEQQQHGGGLCDSKRFELGGKSCSKSEQERRKGIPWTEEEHRLFLLGLDKYGKGDWRSISRNFVISRTPTQVASHAQKYFIRLNSMNRDRRRSSIHDITSINGGDLPSPQGPITGQANINSMAGGPSTTHPPQPNMPPVGMYGPPVGHPVTGHMVSAVGTPVMIPRGHAPYVVPVAYPVPPPPMHQ